MDTTAPPTAPVINSQPPPPTSKIPFIAIAIALVILIAGIVYLSQKSSQPTKQKSSLPTGVENKFFQDDQKIAKVGEEILYGKDLNYTLYSTFNSDFQSKNPSLSKLKELALRKAVDDSRILQIGQKQKIVELQNSFYNNVDKDYQVRQNKIVDVINSLGTSQEIISGAKLAIWFYNMEPPKISQDQAEQLAKQKLTAIHNDIKNSKITFQQGRDRIVNDSSLKQIDRNYIGNAYTEFIDRSPTDGFFSSPGLDKQLLQLGQGEISQVYKYPSDPKSASDERYYYTLTITKRTNSGKGSLIDIIQKESKNYTLTLL